MKSLDRFKTDKQFEKEGVWLDFGDFRILTARSGGSNTKYTQALSLATKPHIRQIQAGMFTPEQNLKILRDVFARTVVLDWTIKDDEEKPLPCTYENKIQIFEEYPDLFSQIMDYSENYSNFLESLREDMAKN